MTCIIDTKAKIGPAKLSIGLVLSAFLAFGTFVAPVSAEGNRANHDNGQRGGDYRGGNRGHQAYNGGHYVTPPIVYGAPGYYPPPVVYGPGLGINIQI